MVSTRWFPSSIAAAMVIGAAVSAAAQPSGSLRVDLPVQHTVNAGTAEASERGISGAGTFEHWFAADRARVFYETALDRFSAGETWSTWLHNAGIAATIGSGKTTFDAGGAAFWRVNDGGWADAGFRGFTLASGITRELANASLSGGYSFFSRTFDDAPALDQLEHYGYARLLANFETRTTVVGTVSLGWKHYAGETITLAGEVGSELPQTHGAGRGARWYASAPPSQYAAGTGVARTEWSWAARLAQSLDDRTGIWIEHGRRRTGGEAPPAVVWTPPLFYDDGVYDDPYAIDAATWSAGARHVFARGDDLRLGVSRSARDYVGVFVVDDLGVPGAARSDTLLRVAAEAIIPLGSSRGLSVDVVGTYGYVDNGSNDPFERYRAHVISAGLALKF